MPSSPFQPSTSKPGHGIIHLALLPPSTPRLRTVSYQYPLKLVSPAPLYTPSISPQQRQHLIHTIYLLTYGGGLVAGDQINLQVTLETGTRLLLLTQGSTKLFKSPSRDVCSSQLMSVDLEPGAALCYLPDPVQPFAQSNFEQRQVYNIALPPPALRDGGSGVGEGSASGASLCVLDWVCNGRAANGEDWSFIRYGSKNEIYLHQPSTINGEVTTTATRKLLLRDNLLLDSVHAETTLSRRMHGLAVFATLILHGPLFESLGRFFMDEFRLLPRIGGRKWETSSDSGGDDEDNADDVDPAVVAAAGLRAVRHRQESADGILWSAATLRRCVVVKLGAREVEGGRRWLRSMLEAEGTVVREFGERAMLCLK